MVDNKTRRHVSLRGGSIETVTKLIEDADIGKVNILNPKSKFVVVTYWWGKENVNKNLYYPCDDELRQLFLADFLLEKVKTDRELAQLYGSRKFLVKAEQSGRLPIGAVQRYKEVNAQWKRVTNAIKDTDEAKQWVSKKIAEFRESSATNTTVTTDNGKEYTIPEGRGKGRTFLEMIKNEWEVKCQQAGVNYLAVNTEFPRSDYQNAINGKPLFIKKVLDAVAPRAVLYIDGDMWIHTYPHIFDIDNVDFMARGWNMDSRSIQGSLENPYYDPYTFETSGGTMYFGNTQRARDLLDEWSKESHAQPGKADDRILSQMFTTKSKIFDVNIINLPIEYLWLTDLYKKFLNSETSPTTIKDAIIEHPYCLTSEEAAKEQGAATSGRQPEGYDEEVVDNIKYDLPTERFYEYIFFNANRPMRDGFDKYLAYMKTAKNSKTGRLMLDIVDFDAKYGEYQTIANKNLTITLPSGPAGSVTRLLTLPKYNANPKTVSLPQTASISDILKVLYEGNNAQVGVPDEPPQPGMEFVGTYISKTPIDSYLRSLEFDASAPMFFSGSSHMIWHLLAMCETVRDINKHIARSYMFMSRIRWQLVRKESSTSFVYPPDESTGFKPIVHQIWFGGEIPQWRQSIFDSNKRICEQNRFKYRLWKNDDRTKENFPSTFGYQETAIQKGQSRWAQVADLARLEIVYLQGGIYIDSIIELTPVLLEAVSRNIEKGYTFIGCNEDPCNPPIDCVGNDGKKYLSNSFFAAIKGDSVLERLLDDNTLSKINFDDERINETTGPYYLRTGVLNTEQDKVFLFNSDQIYQFNQEATPYKLQPIMNPFVFNKNVPGSLKVNDGTYFVPGGINLLQMNFLINNNGPLATYNSGLGGTWLK